MPKYVVLKDFTDLTDNRHVYRMGDSFPHAGVNVSDERVVELASANNKRGTALIAEVKVQLVDTTKEKPKRKKSNKRKKEK